MKYSKIGGCLIQWHGVMTPVLVFGLSYSPDSGKAASLLWVLASAS